MKFAKLVSVISCCCLLLVPGMLFLILKEDIFPSSSYLIYFLLRLFVLLQIPGAICAGFVFVFATKGWKWFAGIYGSIILLLIIATLLTFFNAAEHIPQHL